MTKLINNKKRMNKLTHAMSNAFIGTTSEAGVQSIIGTAHGVAVAGRRGKGQKGKNN